MFFVPRDKQTRPGNLPKSHIISEIGDQWIQKYFHFLFFIVKCLLKSVRFLFTLIQLFISLYRMSHSLPTRHFINNSNTNEDITTKQTHTTDTFPFISHTTKLLFKFRCNILIGVRIIKEMPGSVANGTPCSFTKGQPSGLCHIRCMDCNTFFPPIEPKSRRNVLKFRYPSCEEFCHPVSVLSICPLCYFAYVTDHDTGVL